VGYINIKIGGGLEFIPDFLIYPISVLSGSGPLWFAHLAFLYSLIIVGLRKIDKKDVLYHYFGRFDKMLYMLVIVIFIWGSAQILNMPVITVYRFGIYFVSFLIGYFVLSHNRIQEKIEKMLPVSAILSVAFCILYMFKFNGGNFTVDGVLKSFVTNAYAWFTVLFILGSFKRYMNRHDRMSKYLSVNSFAYYVLHYPIVLIVGYCIYYFIDLPLIATVLITLTLELILTVILSQVVKRMPLIRFILLGIRGKKREVQINS
jgi:surface polysaccharide O-acyltransferase-like enzyme